MKFSTALLATIATSLVSAQTFIGYPTGLSCPTSVGTVSFTVDELEEITINGANKIFLEKSASNRALGIPCNTLRLPLWGVDLGKDAGSLLYVYNATSDAYTFCAADGGDVDLDGYPDACSL